MKDASTQFIIDSDKCYEYTKRDYEAAIFSSSKTSCIHLVIPRNKRNQSTCIIFNIYTHAKSEMIIWTDEAENRDSIPSKAIQNNLLVSDDQFRNKLFIMDGLKILITYHLGVLHAM